MKVFILALCACLFVSCNQGVESSSSGDRLYSKGLDSILVAVDEESFDKLIESVSSNPEPYVKTAETLLIQEKAFLVSNNSKILILNSDQIKSQIKILEGENKGKSGWIMDVFVKRYK